MFGNPRRRHVASSREPPGLHLLVHWNEAQELIHMAHSQPVGVEFHRGLHLLGTEEILQVLVRVLAFLAANAGLKECYGEMGWGSQQRWGLTRKSLPDWDLAKRSRFSFKEGIQDPGIPFFFFLLHLHLHEKTGQVTHLSSPY